MNRCPLGRRSPFQNGRLRSYAVTAQIDVGGMEEVYRATDTKLKREVAV